MYGSERICEAFLVVRCEEVSVQVRVDTQIYFCLARCGSEEVSFRNGVRVRGVLVSLEVLRSEKSEGEVSTGGFSSKWG